MSVIFSFSNNISCDSCESVCVHARAPRNLQELGGQEEWEEEKEPHPQLPQKILSLVSNAFENWGMETSNLGVLFQTGGPSSVCASRMAFPMRSGRVGRGCRPLSITQTKDLGPENILSTFSKCEVVQPHLSRIPVRRTDQSNGNKEEVSALQVWKLFQPGLQQQLSLAGVSGKQAALQSASKGRIRKHVDIKSLQFNKGESLAEFTPKVEGTALLPETLNLSETVTLCG